MKKNLLAGLAVLMAIPGFSQENSQANGLSFNVDTIHTLKPYKAGDNWFIGLKGGTNISMSENIRFASFGKRLGGNIELTVGKYFNPAVGVRAEFGYTTQKSRVNSEYVDAYPQIFGNGVYKFNIFSGYLDGLFNFNNIFAKYKEGTRFNVVGILGIGFNSSFGFDDKIDEWYAKSDQLEGGVDCAYMINNDGQSKLAMRAGLQLGYKLNESLDLNLESTAHFTDDGYNGVRHSKKYDTYINLSAGVTYHFKDQYGSRRFKYLTMTDQGEMDELNKKINDARAALVVPEPIVRTETEVNTNKVLDMTVSFIIDKYNITAIQKNNVQKVAEYLVNNPNVNLVVTGYADVQTAYPAYNMKLSKRRAEAVYNMLVNDFNVEPSRLRIDYKGDTIQPYERKNEWNRVVIFVIDSNK